MESSSHLWTIVRCFGPDSPRRFVPGSYQAEVTGTVTHRTRCREISAPSRFRSSARVSQTASRDDGDTDRLS